MSIKQICKISDFPELKLIVDFYQNKAKSMAHNYEQIQEQITKLKLEQDAIITEAGDSSTKQWMEIIEFLKQNQLIPQNYNHQEDDVLEISSKDDAVFTKNIEVAITEVLQKLMEATFKSEEPKATVVVDEPSPTYKDYLN